MTGSNNQLDGHIEKVTRSNLRLDGTTELETGSNNQLDGNIEQVIRSNNQFDGHVEKVTGSSLRLDGTTEQVTENSHKLSNINTLICSECDYETAITIAARLEKHAIAVYQTMPSNNLKGICLTFFEKLPQQFDRQGYLKVAEELGIQPRTADKYIAQFKQLLNHVFKIYSKILK